MLGACYLGGPKRSNQQEPSHFVPLGKGCDPIERGGVAPVKILKPEDQRDQRGNRFHYVSKLPKHTLPSCTCCGSL